MANLKRFGTYGFLSALVAAQMSMAPAYGDETVGDKADRAVTDTKKSARTVRRSAKKAGRKVTGNESRTEDFKDKAGDTVDNTKDELHHAKRKLQKD